MRKKILIAMVAIFSIGLVAHASQTLWIHCVGDYYVPVCTVDAEYFDSEADYHGYIKDLMELMC